MPKTMSATEARIHFGEMMRHIVATKEVVIVERAGRPQVAILPIDEFERLQTLEKRKTWEQTLHDLEEMRVKVAQRRKKLDVIEPEDLIRRMREERDETLLARLR